MVLKQRANFYNNISTEMIPCQKPMLLQDAVDFEKVGLACAPCLAASSGHGVHIAHITHRTSRTMLITSWDAIESAPNQVGATQALCTGLHLIISSACLVTARSVLIARRHLWTVVAYHMPSRCW